jgi:APA family basic amino acid/polyamine antiporter
MSHLPTIEPKEKIGLFSLTAIALNGIVGAAIFVLPATMAKMVGQAASIFPYVIAFSVALLIGLCFAELGTISQASGGPYVYARQAFGDLAGFEAGWLFILARLTAVAAIADVFASYLAYFIPIASSVHWRIIFITLLLFLLSGAHCLGLRFGVYILNSITVGKLFPLVLLILVGVFWVHQPRQYLLTLPAMVSLRKASLLLVFAFTGFEYASVPSEEVVNSRRTTPLAMILAICFTGVLYVLIQIVAISTVPNLATNTTPLATAAEHIFGSSGSDFITLGALLSSAGTISAATLVGPRIMHALARGGQLPEFVGRIHPRFGTPWVSIALFAIMAWVCAVFGNFAALAALSSIARLLYYIACCLAVPALRTRFKRSVTRASNIVVGMAIALCLWLLTSVTWKQTFIGVAALLVGAVIYWSYGRWGRCTSVVNASSRISGDADRVGRYQG